uniref:Uncharacterized protein n=1 Tax=Pseudo-nitzschia australis TaxID=44445 RepID=A0A7S4AUG7_9STRA
MRMLLLLLLLLLLTLLRSDKTIERRGPSSDNTIILSQSFVDLVSLVDLMSFSSLLSLVSCHFLFFNSSVQYLYCVALPLSLWRVHRTSNRRRCQYLYLDMHSLPDEMMHTLD